MDPRGLMGSATRLATVFSGHASSKRHRRVEEYT